MGLEAHIGAPSTRSASRRTLRVRELGCVPYAEALAMQEDLVASVDADVGDPVLVTGEHGAGELGQRDPWGLRRRLEEGSVEDDQRRRRRGQRDEGVVQLLVAQVVAVLGILELVPEAHRLDDAVADQGQQVALGAGQSVADRG